MPLFAQDKQETRVARSAPSLHTHVGQLAQPDRDMVGHLHPQKPAWRKLPKHRATKPGHWGVCQPLQRNSHAVSLEKIFCWDHESDLDRCVDAFCAGRKANASRGDVRQGIKSTSDSPGGYNSSCLRPRGTFEEVEASRSYLIGRYGGNVGFRE